jgi:predicted nucleic acid-binding Zn ribbon protein
MNKELQLRLNRKKHAQNIGDAIQDYLKQNKLEDRFLESFLQAEWKNIVGDVVAKYTTSIYLKDQKAILKIESAPLRNELLMSKRLLLKNIQSHLNTLKISDVVFV